MDTVMADPRSAAPASHPVVPPVRLALGIAPLRLAVGVAISILGLFALMHGAWGWVRVRPEAMDALRGGLVAAGLTAAGALGVLLVREANARAQAAMAGFGAGIMLAASVFSLVLPGIAAMQALGSSRGAAVSWVSLALLLGGAAMFVLERALPHVHGPELGRAARPVALRTWLFVGAIVIHNIPEGLAIGVGFAGPDAARAASVALGIGIQDVPEGLVVALALHAIGMSRLSAAGVGIASGLVEPVAAVLGAVLVTFSAAALPRALGAAAGAMLFVISHEIIPESHRTGHESVATAGLLLGFVAMLVLDVAAG